MIRGRRSRNKVFVDESANGSLNQIDPVCAIRLFRRLNHACQV